MLAPRQISSSNFRPTSGNMEALKANHQPWRISKHRNLSSFVFHGYHPSFQSSGQFRMNDLLVKTCFALHGAWNFDLDTFELRFSTVSHYASSNNLPSTVIIAKVTLIQDIRCKILLQERLSSKWLLFDHVFASGALWCQFLDVVHVYECNEIEHFVLQHYQAVRYHSLLFSFEVYQEEER
jgi:hypothetical protein